MDLNLEVLRKKVSEEVESLKCDLADLSNRVPDFADAGQIVTHQLELQEQLRMKKRYYEQLVVALAKESRGQFGICEDCDAVIPQRRLMILPATPCCVDCQEIRAHKRQLA